MTMRRIGKEEEVDRHRTSDWKCRNVGIELILLLLSECSNFSFGHSLYFIRSTSSPHLCGPFLLLLQKLMNDSPSKITLCVRVDGMKPMWSLALRGGGNGKKWCHSSSSSSSSSFLLHNSNVPSYPPSSFFLHLLSVISASIRPVSPG
jgi:hypothetical protein